jgi:crossover junction endodeoxyribonuclease RuvC
MTTDSTGTVIFGIDPGITGAVAILSGYGEVYGLCDAPTIQVTTGKKKRRELLPLEMAAIVGSYSTCRRLAFIEWAQAMPGQGVTSMFSYGQGFGLWLGILAALGISTTKVRPRAWKKAMLEGHDASDKASSVARAAALFPEAKLGKKSDAGRAEALLIAEYGRLFCSAREGDER